jgi:hypothetical protein
MPHDVKAIAREFEILGEFLEAKPYGSGHINDTYLAAFNQGGTRVQIVFQRINHVIFKNPPALMENVVRVTDHIRSKLEAAGANDVSRRVLTVIPTRQGAHFHKDADGNYWRAYIFIEKARTFDTLESPDQAFEAAKAFGFFQKMLVDLPGGPLNETIPDFHNGPKRFKAFQAALEADACNRAAGAKADVDFLQKHACIFDILPTQVAKGAIPLRVTHNDTKINNVMLDDETGKGLCVIDLDTVMPGLALYDFGDIVRTTTSPAAEDEPDVSKVVMEMPRFEAIVRGYLSTAGEFLTQAERAHLVTSGKMITLMIGTRFLTDYLAGDTYFKVHRNGHNLDRSRAQFKLVQSIEEQEDEMNALVERI